MKATEKHKLIERIRTIEGLTDEERSELLKLLQEHKKYGLVWEDKPEDVEERLREELPVLTEVKDRAIISDNPDAPNHILIEGDNLEALTTLAYTHEGKIDVIYIDPPYNTGNKDFVYYDDFSDDYRTLPYVEKEDAYRHSKWLSFMSRRLKIAKKLLSERGVIFISIDDNEQANLKLLCDEIFEEKHFIADLIWQKKFARANDALYFSTMHDHILCYCRKRLGESDNAWKLGLISRGDKVPSGYSNPDNDSRGVWTSTILSAKSGSDSLLYEIISPSGKKFFPPSGRYWSCNKETFEKWKSEGRIWFGKKGDAAPRKKTFLTEVQEGLRPNTILFHDEVGHNQEGKQELKNIFNGRGIFDGPKPIRLISFLLRIANIRSAIVLDFFAGSGTTLHAVMQLNAEEDGGHRTCILCTNNERNICEEVTYERNKRVIQGYTKPNGEFVEGLTDNNLRYYRTDFISRSRSTKNMRRLVRLATDMLCIKENLYTEQKTFAGMSTFKNIYRFFDDGKKQMLVIYDENYVAEIVKYIEKTDYPEKIKVYVFSPSEDPWEADFEPVSEKVALCALPQAIYNTYKRILPKHRNKPLDETKDYALNQSDESDLGGLFAAEPEKGGQA